MNMRSLVHRNRFENDRRGGEHSHPNATQPEVIQSDFSASCCGSETSRTFSYSEHDPQADLSPYLLAVVQLPCRQTGNWLKVCATDLLTIDPEAQVNITRAFIVIHPLDLRNCDTRLESQTFEAGKRKPSSPAPKLVGGGESLLGSSFHYEREGEFFA